MDVLAAAEQSLHSINAFSVSHSAPHKQVCWVWARGWEGTQLGQLTQTDQSDFPYRVTSCSAITLLGELFQSSQRSGNGWAMVSWWWVTDFASLVCLGYFSPPSLIKLPLSQPLSFLSFTLLIVSPISPRGEWANGSAVLSCQLGWNHTRGCAAI